MSERDDSDSSPNRPAMRDDIIYAVAAIVMAMVLCNATDSCSRRLQINKAAGGFTTATMTTTELKTLLLAYGLLGLVTGVLWWVEG